MVKKLNSSKDFFYIQCGNWEGTALASTPKEACAIAVKQARNLFKTKLKTTDVVISMKLKDSIEQRDDSVNAFCLNSFIKTTYE